VVEEVTALFKGKSIAVVVPAFNEGRLMGQTLDSVPSYVDRIYAVDDASTDATQSIVLERSARDSRISIVRHEMNAGVGASIVSGYKMALMDRIDIAAVVAGDGQMDPQYLPNLLDPIIEGRAEYTKGNRLFGSDFRVGMTAWRYFGNLVLTYLNKIASGYWDVADPQNGYTAITARALSVLDLDRIYPRYAFENDMLVKLNVHNVTVLNVPIPARYGEEESKIRYGNFILKTSAFFLRAFCWRIWKKYLSRNWKGDSRSRSVQSAIVCSMAASPNNTTLVSALGTRMDVPSSGMTPHESIAADNRANQHTGDAGEEKHRRTAGPGDI
jgi:glycosyltransferase involved in cell wall biosynthesis